METGFFKTINDGLLPFGLQVRGRALPLDEDSLFLIGSVGGGFFGSFKESPEYQSGEANPLDKWSKRIIDSLCEKLPADTEAIYPFDKPSPPFQQWAKGCDDVWSSPLGLLIHKDYGLWHAYRGAIKITNPCDAEKTKDESPCESCENKPCLNTCPVSAFSGDNYNVPSCRSHLQSDSSKPCFDGACLARRACPVGKDFAYTPEVANFFMRSFLKSLQKI